MGDKERGQASVRAAFRLAAQYIALAQALQPGKDVYCKSLQVQPGISFARSVIS